MFFICRSCYRGQRYCSEACRRVSRREQLRAANHRHQRSPEGRLDHRDRQRAYRWRRRIQRVTDQGSATRISTGIIAAPRSIRQTRAARGRPCCRVCGRRGRFIEMFKHRE